MKLSTLFIASVICIIGCSKHEVIEPVKLNDYIQIGYSIDRGNASAYWIDTLDRMAGVGPTYIDMLYREGDTLRVKIVGLVYFWGERDSIGFKIFRNKKLTYSESVKFPGYIEWQGVVENDGVRTISCTKY